MKTIAIDRMFIQLPPDPVPIEGGPFACVPRTVFDRYCALPWADVKDAAERGVDGLTLQHVEPRRWIGQSADEPPPDPPDVAFLREGDGVWGKGRAVLYQQNW